MVPLLPILGAILSGCTGPTGNGRPDDTDPIDTDDSGGNDTDDTGTPPPSYDKDEDGYIDCNAPDDVLAQLEAGEECDCDDSDPAQNASFQRLNGIDTNCDGNLDIDLDRDATTIEIGEYDGVAGGSAAAFGDVDGDGLADVILGSPNEGRVYGILGSSGKLVPGNILQMPDDADFVVSDTSEIGGGIGGAIQTADLNGDGKAEIIFGDGGYNSGAAHDWAGEGEGTNSGAIIIMSGRSVFDSEYEINYDTLQSDSALASLDMAVIKGWGNSSIGDYVHVTGDVDGDGYGEIIAGDGSHCYAVPARSYSGTQEITDLYDTYGGYYLTDNNGLPYGSDFCAYVADGDADGDGLTDLLLANPYDAEHDGAGEVTLLMGGSWPSSLNIYDLTDSVVSGLRYLVFEGNGPSYEAGQSLSLSDLDGDGLADPVIGVANENEPYQDAGKVYFVPGADAATAVDGTNPYFSSGDHVTLDGDVYDLGGFAIYGDVPDANISSNGLTGSSDTSGDGLKDLVVGASTYAVSSAGKGFYFDGASLAAVSDDEISCDISEQKLTGESGSNFGNYAVGGGDVDNDGAQEVLINAPSAPDLTSRGVSYLFFGGPQ